MSPPVEFDRELLLEALSGALEPVSDALVVMNRWLERGDGVAIYRNEDLGHPHLGHRQFVSYGSPEAQIVDAFPPTRMPDIGGAINWRYQLEGTYREGRL